MATALDVPSHEVGYEGSLVGAAITCRPMVRPFDNGLTFE